MNLRINVDHQDFTYTNGDVVSGNVIIYCPTSAKITSVVISLEGESSSVTRSKSGLCRELRETHPILRMKKKAWPMPDDDLKRPRTSLTSGYHKFPFSFKIPHKNSCDTSNGVSPSFNLDSMITKLSHQPAEHSSQILPPSLHNSVKGADINYRIGAVVGINGIMKQHLRHSVEINFQPFDPRRDFPNRAPLIARKITNVRADISTDMTATDASHDLAKIMIKAQLPSDATLTCQSQVPLQLSVRKMSCYQGVLLLQNVQIMLKWHTQMQAQGTEQLESQSWILQSLCNLNAQIGQAFDPMGTETFVDVRLWQDKILPKAVVPSFKTCNISRAYTLEILLGFQYSSSEGRLMVVQLNIPVSVFSGIGLERIYPRRSRPDSPMETFDLVNAAEHFERDEDCSREQGNDFGTYGQRCLEPPPPTYEEAIRRGIQYMI